MNEDREKILEQIRDTDIEDLLIPTPKKSKKAIFKEVLKEVFLGKLKFIAAIFGATEDNIKNNTSSGHVGGGHAHHSHSGASDFKSQYVVQKHPGTINPIDIANARAYMQSIDGKGDHDCGHEH